MVPRRGRTWPSDRLRIDDILRRIGERFGFAATWQRGRENQSKIIDASEAELPIGKNVDDFVGLHRGIESDHVELVDIGPRVNTDCWKRG